MYELYGEENKPVMLSVMPQDDSVEFEDGQKSSGKSQKSYKSFLGYQYISFAILGRS